MNLFSELVLSCVFVFFVIVEKDARYIYIYIAMFHPVNVFSCLHAVVRAETVCRDWNDLGTTYASFASIGQ